MLTVNREVPEELKIGTSEWLESDNDEENFLFSPSNVFKKCKFTNMLKLSKPKDSGKERFSETVSEEQLAVLSKGLVPVNTSPVTILYDFLSYFEFLHVFVKPI